MEPLKENAVDFIIRTIKENPHEVTIAEIGPCTNLAAAIVDPSILTKEVTLPVDVNDTYSLSYGQTIAYKGYDPEGSRKARIIQTVDTDKVHNMFKQLFDKL